MHRRSITDLIPSVLTGLLSQVTSHNGPVPALPVHILAHQEAWKGKSLRFTK